MLLSAGSWDASSSDAAGKGHVLHGDGDFYMQVSTKDPAQPSDTDVSTLSVRSLAFITFMYAVVLLVLCVTHD